MSFCYDFLFSAVQMPIPFISHSPFSAPPLIAGTSGALSCNYSLRYPIGYARASATWTVNGSAVNTTGRISTDGPTDFYYTKGPSLFFSPFIASDSGRYTCTLYLSYHEGYVTLEGSKQSTEKTIKVYCKLIRTSSDYYN